MISPEHPLRHDPEKLSQALLQLLKERQPRGAEAALIGASWSDPGN